jgi:undecaprenyl-diphosphatase
METMDRTPRADSSRSVEQLPGGAEPEVGSARRPTVDDPARRPSSRIPFDRRRAAAVVAGLVGLAVLVGVVALEVADPDADGGLSIAAAVLLGLIEGVTEWLPVSSTGHLKVAQAFLGIEGDAADSYAIAIQAGAILAVLGLYRQRFRAMVEGVLGRDAEGRRTAVAVAVACLPAVVIGLVFEDTIKGRLYGTWPVVVAWFVGGLVILAVARQRRGTSPTAGAALTSLGWRGALVIGMAQTLALWPGVSRSLVTIVAATALGLAVPAAVEFSFLLGFVILGGATVYETVSSGADMVEAYGLLTPVIGLVVAFVASAAAMRWMLGYLNRHGLGIFGWYRIGIAAVVGGLLVAGVL